MDRWPLGPEEIEMIRQGRADEVERRLLDHYESVKPSGDPRRILNATSALAHFYQRKNALEQAEGYLREGIKVSPSAESALQMVFFSHFVLGDPQKTLEEARVVRSMADTSNPYYAAFLYTNLAVEGQAYLALGQFSDAARNLEEMLRLAERGRVSFGDEFEFVRQMIERGQSVDVCKALLDIARVKVRSGEYKEKMEQLLEDL